MGMTKKTSEIATEMIIKLRKEGFNIAEISRIIGTDCGENISKSTVSAILKKSGIPKLARRTGSEIYEKITTCETIEDLEKISDDELENIPEDLRLGYGFHHSSLFLAICVLLAESNTGKDLRHLSLPNLEILSPAQFVLTCLVQEILGDLTLSDTLKVRQDPSVALVCGLNQLPSPQQLSKWAGKLSKDSLLELQSKLSNICKTSSTSRIFEVLTSIQKNTQTCDITGKSPKYLSYIVRDQSTDEILAANWEDECVSKMEVLSEVVTKMECSGRPAKSVTLMFDRAGISNSELNRLHKRGVKFVTTRKVYKSIIEQTKNSPKWEFYPFRSYTHRRMITESINDLKDYMGDITQFIIDDPDESDLRVVITNNDAISPEQMLNAVDKKWGVNALKIGEEVFFKVDDSPALYMKKICQQLKHNLYCKLRNLIPEFEGLNDKQISRTTINKLVFIQVVGGIITAHVHSSELLKQLSTMPGSAFTKVTDIPWMKGMSIKFIDPTLDCNN